MQNILLTGAAGFIGSNLTDYLLNLNHKIICLDNFDDFYGRQIKKENLSEAVKSKSFELIEGDIRDTVLLNKIFLSNKIDLVIHLAARAGVRPSLLNPDLYYDVNLNGTLALLEAMRFNNVKKMIFASSSSIYGNNKKLPFSENDFVDEPISPYASSKRAAELLCYTYHYLYKFDIFCLRFFTVYGPRQRPEMAIHNFVNKIMNGNPITIFGDGNSARDYTYIDDIIDGVYKSVKNLKGYEIINLGESQTIKLIELINKIENLLSKKAVLKHIENQPGDMEETYADISKAKSKINYTPIVNIEKGLEKFIDWYKNQKGNCGS